MSKGLAQPGTTPEPSAAQDAAKVWLTEPDRKEWIDPTTGYACLAQRGPTGAWCGYVGVPPQHAAHGLPYDSYGLSAEEALAIGPAKLAIRAAVGNLEAHGGLTFAGKRDHEAAPETTHWFGFDCAHAGDFSPTYDDIDHPVLGLGKPTGWGDVYTYRTLEYVEEQITALAAQLAKVDAEAGQ